LLLSITSGSLRSFQEDNVRLDTKKQILNSLPGIELGEDAAATYAATIKEYNMLDAEGNVVKSLDPVADFDIKAEEGQFPMYVAEVNGETKYILPMNGAGLWGAIWGYMALNDDRNTVFGVFFNHAGETPGLGAEIVTEKFRNPFIGKELLKNGKFASIAIEKAGTKVEGRDQVDAISGGTITSKGVEAMLSSSLVNYENFLTAPAAIVVEEVADSVIVEPVIEE
jgi:Na+-transporting NADH:ubiquinone oxidoreductase subunit C